MHMSWFVYAISAVMVFTSYDLLSRYFGSNSKDPQAFAVVYNSLAFLVALVFFLFEPTQFVSQNLSVVVLGLLGLLVWGFFGRVEYETRKRVQASLLTIFTRLAYIVTFVLSVIFLHESVSLHKIMALLLILMANLLVAQKLERKHLEGAVYAVLLSVILGTGWFIDKFVSAQWGISFYIMLSFFSPILVSALVPPLGWERIKGEINNTAKWMVVLPVINVSGYYLMLKAFSLAEGSRVILVIAFTQILTILLSALFLGEKEHFGRKIIAGVLGVIALILLQI